MGRRAGRPPLTRQRIIETALALIDEVGLDGLSMRQLGRRLEVDPMAIYHHLPSKDELLQAVVRHVFAKLPVRSAGGSWQQRVKQWARDYRGVAGSHPNLVLRIVAEPLAVAVAAVQANESLYAALEAGGLPADIVMLGADLIVDYVNGVAVATATGAVQDPAALAAFEAELAAQPPERVAVQRRLLDEADYAGRDSFEFGLEVILAGLQRRRTASDVPPA